MSDIFVNSRENELPPAFIMWKMFHSTISAIFKNLDNAENNLQELAKTLLSSKECSDIFIPRYDPTLSFEQNGEVEKNYQAFTTWLLGKLFYLLSYEKFERIYDLFIEAQQKIIIVLQLNRPHIFDSVIKEYNDALTIVNQFLNSNLDRTNEGSLFIHNFVTENIIFNDEILELTPIFVELKTLNSCYVLQANILKLLEEPSLWYILRFWFDKTSKSILDNFVLSLHNSNAESKIVIVQYLNKLTIQSYFQIKESPVLDKHFQDLLFYLEKVIYELEYGCNFNLDEIKMFDFALSNLFDTIVKFEIIKKDNFVLEKCKNITNFLILFKLRDSRGSKEFLNSTIKLLTEILSYENQLYPEINFIINYCINTRSCAEVDFMLQYQIYEELKKEIKNNVIDVSAISPTWKVLYNDLNTQLELCLNNNTDINVLSEILYYFKCLMHTAQIIYFKIKAQTNNSGPLQVTFIPTGEIINKIKRILNIYNINTSSQTLFCLDCIVDTLSYIISFSFFTQWNIKNLISMLEIVNYPITKKLPDVQVLMTSDYTEELSIERQLKAIEILSTCMLSVDSPERFCFKDMRGIVLEFFKKYASSKNTDVLIQVTQKLMYFVGSLRRETEILYEILQIFLESKDPQIIRALSANFGKLICVFSGNFIIVPNITENCVCFDINCLQCDFTKKKEEGILYRISDHEGFSVSQFIAQKNVLQNSRTNMNVIFNLLDSNDVEIRRSIIMQLPRFSKHLAQFHTIPITKKWLKCMEDDDVEVRTRLVSLIKPLVNDIQNNSTINDEYKKMMLETCLTDLRLATKQHIRSGNAPLIETLLDTIHEIGCLNNLDVLNPTSKLLIYYLLLCNTYLSTNAVSYLRNIAESHNITTESIFYKQKKDFCRIIGEIGVVAFIDMEYNISQSLERAALAFGFTVREFLTRNGHHLIPYFIPCFVTLPESYKILNDIASLLGIEPAELIINNFSYIYTHVYLNQDQEVFGSCMQLIERVTGKKINILKKKSIKVIHNELVLNFYDKKDLVSKELYQLTLEESDSSSEKSSSRSNSEKDQQIATYLDKRFLGILVYFDTKLTAKNSDDSVKTKILQSLPVILKLMGTQFITPNRHKVLATLRTALSSTDKKYYELICDDWDAFVHCCEVESFGPLLSTIFVSLLPLLDHYPRKITAIFKYLLVENNETLKEFIPDLFFINDTKVDNELKNIINNHLAKNKNKSCKEKLRDFLPHIEHENTEVRVFGLEYLKNYLEGKHVELEDLILGNNGMDGVVVDIIDALITGSREKDKQVRLTCGQCIGKLGAIEPSHFPRKYTSESSPSFSFYLTDDSFIVNALMELLRSFQNETFAQPMNRFSLAIQEIIKAHGVSPDENAPKHNLWNMFPKISQELMKPLLSSRYTVAAPSSDKVSISPILGSHLGSNFEDWRNNWTSHLISLLANDNRKLMYVCKPGINSDQRTFMIFLPHILVHAILECQEKDRQGIYDEFMAVLNFLDGQKKMDTKHLKYQPLKTKQYVKQNNAKDNCNMSNCVKIIFVLLDYLDHWLLKFESKKCPKSTNQILERDYKIIQAFFERICKLKIAKCNFLRGEYPRALMYLEQYVSNDRNKLKEHLGFFTRIYAELEEPDGVAGAMALKETDPSIEDMILAHNVSGHFQDVVACYERMAQEHTLASHYLEDMIRCYLELDNPYTALNIASAALDKFMNDETEIYEWQAEPYWRLGMFDELTELLHKPGMKHNSNWGVRVGQSLVHFRNGDRLNFKKEIDNIQALLIDMFNITSLEEGVYRNVYPHIIKLHILNELQKAEEIVHELKQMTDKTMCEKVINELVEEWDIRLKVVQSSVRAVEPILRMRRIILEQTQHVLGPQSETIKPTFDKHIAKYWLKSAEIARQSSTFQQAYIYILKADQYKPKELFVEKAKLYWAKEDHDLAFSTLKRGVEEYFPDAATFKDMDPSLRKSDRKLCAEAKLLIATYNDETSNVDMEVNMTNYREAADMCREWEKSHVCLGQYYDRIFSTMSDEDKDLKGAKMQIHIINSFGKSLQYGSTYIYQSMPRMLSIWFDCGTRIVESLPTDNAKARESKKSTLMQMIKLIDTYLDRLPAYMFLSAFSQLVSRICHPVREVYMQIKSILIKLILKYPQQSMWMMMAVSKSAYAMRTKRCQEVLQDERIKNSRIIKLVHDFNRLADKLIELCNKPISEGVMVTSVNTLIRTLPRLLQNKDFSQIMIPIQRMRKLVLPNPEFSNSQYNPFPNAMVFITNIEDEVQVLQSLQRPRKITFRGSDGKQYIHMLKPKDDLRKDFRLMEFNDVVNLYLHREAESRQRRLCIRTYSVVPLNEECGIIEWVDNLVGLRPILMKIYKQRGIYVSARELKGMMCNVRDELAKKRTVFERELLPKHPPVLSEWFRRTFPDAHCWYHARSAYVTTSAVVSMVGYVLGLGDRHGENILFDSTNGDTVHVDFNCLFNKGETFDWPERVPFRLTHNMVDAMGPLGVEGTFRRTCAVTLKVLRTHIDTLMSIVRPFVYDPLVSWPRNQLLKSDTSEAERTNEQAVEHIRNIELRLQGMIKTRGKAFSISLSCEGQANNLIAEATNIDNLSQMYIGWGPYL